MAMPLPNLLTPRPLGDVSVLAAQQTEGKNGPNDKADSDADEDQGPPEVGEPRRIKEPAEKG